MTKNRAENSPRRAGAVVADIAVRVEGILRCVRASAAKHGQVRGGCDASVGQGPPRPERRRRVATARARAAVL